MKESIGGIQLFIIVFLMIILFTGIVSFTINHTNAFSVKDSIITIIEKNGGLEHLDWGESDYSTSTNPQSEISNLLVDRKYRQTGDCGITPSTDIKVRAFKRNGELATNSNETSYCIVRYDSIINDEISCHYKVITFYNLDLPGFDLLLNFTESGETKQLLKCS